MKNTIRATLVVLSLVSGLMIGCDVPDQAPSPDQPTAVSGALANTGGGGSSNSWWCSDDGLCTCSGGTLSSDCWGLSQYCIDSYDCRVSPPYLCYCHWKAAVQSPGIKTTIGTGVIGTVKAISR